MSDDVRINYDEGMRNLSGHDDDDPFKGLKTKNKAVDDIAMASSGGDDLDDKDLSANIGNESQDLEGPSDDTFIDTSNFN